VDPAVERHWALYVSSGIAIAVVGWAIIWTYRRRRVLVPDTTPHVDPAVYRKDVVVKDAKVVVSCPRCSGRLRIPSQLGTLVVTCPNCKHRWDYVSASGTPQGV